MRNTILAVALLGLSSCGWINQPANKQDPTGPTRGDAIIEKVKEVGEDTGNPLVVGAAVVASLIYGAYKGKKAINKLNE